MVIIVPMQTVHGHEVWNYILLPLAWRIKPEWETRVVSADELGPINDKNLSLSYNRSGGSYPEIWIRSLYSQVQFPRFSETIYFKIRIFTDPGI